MPSLYRHLSPVALAVLDSCDYYGEGEIITRINVPKAYRGQGHGTSLLREACANADANGVNLWLEISSSDGLDYYQLKAWYIRHGFRNYRGIWRRKAKARVPA